MRSFLVAIGAALFAGLSVAQNLTEINNLPPCGVSQSNELLLFLGHFTELSTESVHHQHAGSSKRTGLPF